MIYSIILSALVVGIALFFGHQKKERLADLESEWEELKRQAAFYQIPEDPEKEYAPARVGMRTVSSPRADQVSAFATELVALMKEMKEMQKKGQGHSLEVQVRGMDLFLKMTEFSGAEIKLLVDEIANDPSLDENTKNEMAMMAIMLLSQEEPEVALTMILETREKLLKKGRMADHFIGMAIGQLASDDPMAALSWMKENKDDIGGISDDLRQQVLSGAAREDLRGAFALAKEMDFQEDHPAFFSLSRAVTIENIDEFLEGVRGMEKKEGQSPLVNLANSPFWEDFERATTWLEETELSVKERDELVKSTHFHVARNEPERWLSWLNEQDTEASKQASNNMIRGWAQQDFRSAGEWINTLEKGERRDDAVYQYAGVLRQHEPEAAFEWAETLPESQRKSDLLKKIGEKLAEE